LRRDEHERRGLLLRGRAASTSNCARLVWPVVVVVVPRQRWCRKPAKPPSSFFLFACGWGPEDAAPTQIVREKANERNIKRSHCVAGNEKWKGNSPAPRRGVFPGQKRGGSPSHESPCNMSAPTPHDPSPSHPPTPPPLSLSLTVGEKRGGEEGRRRGTVVKRVRSPPSLFQETRVQTSAASWGGGDTCRVKLLCVVGEEGGRK
jgi:hypothetical protein